MPAGDSLEVGEGDHDHGHIVQRLAHEAVLEDTFDTEAAVLVHADVLFRLLLCNLRLLLTGRLSALGLPGRLAGQPDGLANVVIGQLIVDAIGGQGNKIVLLCDLESSDVGNSLDNVWVAATILEFGLRVTESPANRQTAGKHAYWAHDELWVGSLLLGWLLYLLLLVEHLRGRGLVDLPAGLDDALVLFEVGGLVISTQRGHLLPRVR